MNYTGNEGIKAPKPLRIIGKAIKWCFIVFVVLMIGWVLLRGFLQDGTSKMKKYVWTEEAKLLYEDKGSFSVWELTEFNDSSLDRIFYIGSLYYTEELSQFQFMLRFNENNASVKEIEAPEGEEERFLFVLADDKGNRYAEYEYITDSAMMYGYYRIVFSDVDLTEATELNVYVYRNTGEEFDFHSYIDRCTVWYNDGYKSKYKLSSSEKRADKPTDGMISASVPLAEEEEAEPENPDNTTESGESRNDT